MSAAAAPAAIDYAAALPIDVCLVAARVWNEARASTHEAIASELLAAAHAVPAADIMLIGATVTRAANARRPAWHVEALVRARAIMEAKYDLSAQSHVNFARLVEAEIVRENAGHRKHLESWIGHATIRARDSAFEALTAK